MRFGYDVSGETSEAAIQEDGTFKQPAKNTLQLNRRPLALSADSMMNAP